MTENMIPEEFLSGHLFLLVGANPLPNLVAALLLAKPGGAVWLLHSDGSNKEPSTKRFAERLENAIRERMPNISVQLEGIPSSDNLGIETRVFEILERIKGFKDSVGLNYTGGTKPMALHTYRTLQCVFGKNQVNPTFSYIDPRQISLRIEGKDTTRASVFSLSEAPLRAAVEVDLDEVAALHGYLPADRRAYSWASDRDISTLCRRICDVHATKAGFDQWRDWINQGCCSFPSIESFPHLKSVLEAMEELCGGQGNPDLLAAIIKKGASADLSSCKSWFQGYWLEEYCDICLQELVKKYKIKLRRNVLYTAKDESSDYFELDLAVMLGYQLFAISCIAADRKHRAKEHLLEVFVRARQLGGDEARIGLVCCYENSTHLEKELARQWDAEGRIKVFGRNELKELKHHFEWWFRTANL